MTVPGNACPQNGALWTDTVQASEIVNATRPVFTYDGATVQQITSVSTFLAVDRDTAKAPAEATLTSGVFLRNQNRRPIASFSYVALAGRNVQLNAQASRDPEGGILTYEWKDGATVLSYPNAIANYVPSTSGPHEITLTVKDVDGLTGTQTQVVDVKP